METKYGSLTRGMLAAHKQMRARMAARNTNANGTAPGQAGEKRAMPRSIFTTLRGGMQQLVDALEATAQSGVGAEVDGGELRWSELEAAGAFDWPAKKRSMMR